MNIKFEDSKGKTHFIHTNNFPLIEFFYLMDNDEEKRIPYMIFRRDGCSKEFTGEDANKLYKLISSWYIDKPLKGQIRHQLEID